MNSYDSAGKVRWAIGAVALLGLIGQAWALDVAVPYVKADYMWAQGYSGDGVEIGVIDLYLADAGHPAIDGNYLGSENMAKGPNILGEHATLVAGAAASQDSTYTGVAPQAGWWTVQTTNPATMSTQRRQTRAAETLAQGLGGLSGNPVEVINLSIGLSGSTAGTDQWSLGLDHIIQTNGQTITVAAGNSGPGSTTLDGLPRGAYNTIMVGATGDTNGSASEDYSHVANYSSRGPTDDGRARPDIVAPGSYIHVPVLNDGWGTYNGTSIAAPIVAGGAALLIDMGQDLGYSTAPEVIKSVLLNSADKLEGWSHSSTQPLDLSQGAVQMNLESAYQQYIDSEQDPGTVLGTGWDTQEATWASENFYSIDDLIPYGEICSATLSWNRMVNTNTEDIDDVIYSLDHLDNLDLFLYEASDLTTPLASSVSTIDNVEHIYYSIPQTGSYVLGVKMTDPLAGDSQLYGLAWDVLTEPPLLDGDVDRDGFVDSGDLNVIIANWGLSDASRIQGDLTGEGYVGGPDYNEVLAHWGTGTAPEPENIPEPTTAVLLLVGALAFLRRTTNLTRVAVVRPY